MREDRLPEELVALFASYRGALDGVEPSRNFMPVLWGRIEQRRRVTYGFGRMAKGFVTLAAAICLMLSAVLWTPSHLSPFSTATYVDVLADNDTQPDFEQADSL